MNNNLWHCQMKKEQNILKVYKMKLEKKIQILLKILKNGLINLLALIFTSKMEEICLRKNDSYAYFLKC